MWVCNLVGFKNGSKFKCTFIELNSNNLDSPLFLCFIEFNLNEIFFICLSLFLSSKEVEIDHALTLWAIREP